MFFPRNPPTDDIRADFRIAANFPLFSSADKYRTRGPARGDGPNGAQYIDSSDIEQYQSTLLDFGTLKSLGGVLWLLWTCLPPEKQQYTPKDFNVPKSSNVL